MIDKVISHYKIISQLGQGGMGVLYLAEDLELNRKAVLKFLPPDMMNDPDINLRFKREAQSAGSLSHPNIVTIYDVGVHENKTFIAMEFVEGKTLRELIKSDELTIERITDISIQICEGLNEAHSKGIIHRDIKPENILVEEKGKVKIVDFGLAKVKNVSKELTKESSTLGTIKYMSPEQIRNQRVDHRTDIWSFGVILYEMITGKYPFKGEHDASIFYSVINQSPEPLARYKANISEGFQRIIDKSLDKDPETRYQHIDEVLSDLRREKKESGEHSVGKRRTKKLNKRIPLIISAVAFIVLCTMVIVYLLNNPTKNVKPPKYTQLTFAGNIYHYEGNTFCDRSQISPDGQYIAYVVDKGESRSIFIKDILGESEIELFDGLKSVNCLKWSPTGNEIFFSAGLNNSTYSSYIIPKLGGKTQQFQFNSSGCWSPDGSLIAGIRSSDKQIKLIKRETGDIYKLLNLKGTFTWLFEIDWSPDGKKLAFNTLDNNTGTMAIWTINIDGTQQQKIVEVKNEIYVLKWSFDGNYIYYLQSDEEAKQSNENTQNLWKIEISSDTEKKSKAIQTGMQAFGFSISNDNKKLCFTRSVASSNLWKFSYNKEENNFQSKKITEGTSLFAEPKISPDKNEITYVFKGNIFKMDINGNSVKQLTFLTAECFSPSWSPDGREIAFIADLNLSKVFSNGDTPKIFNDTRLGFSAYWESSNRIFYNSVGNRNFYIFNPVTEEKKLFIQKDSLGWIFQPRMSSDTQNLAVFWNRIDNQVRRGLWVISLNSFAEKFLVPGSVYPLRWSEDNKWIYAVNSNRSPAELVKVSTINGFVKPIFTLPFGAALSYMDIDITTDGKTIISDVDETTSDVWMIENFDPDVE
ncbi:MAG: serine/threonine-protein kinase [Ignavibacteriales bacterium]|nr:MAG: serine/threonine-protein kinase [Ignavibacteriales bacterium]